MASLPSLPVQAAPAEVAGAPGGDEDTASGDQFGRVRADAGERFRNLVPASQFRLLLRVLFRRAPQSDTQADWISRRFSVAAKPAPSTHSGKRGILDPHHGRGIETAPGRHSASGARVAAKSCRATLSPPALAPGAEHAG